MPTPSPFKLYWHSSSNKNVNPQTPPCLCELEWGREGHAWSQTPASLTSAWGCHNCCNSQHIKMGLLLWQSPRYIWLLWFARTQVHDLLSSDHLAKKGTLMQSTSSSLCLWCPTWQLVEKQQLASWHPLAPLPVHPPPEFHHCLLCFWLRRIRYVHFGK